MNDLETLNHSTERDFLAVGEKLMESRSTAREISSDMTALTELVSGEHGRNASHALTGMLEQSRAMDARIEQSGQALAHLCDHSRHIRQAFTGLRSTVSIFRTLCTLTRIETSRLGSTGADFGDLAAEVGPLSEVIQSSARDVEEASSRLDQVVQSAIRNVSGLRARQLKELPALIAAVINGLKSFEERQQGALESSVRQAAQYKALCDAVDGVVTSIQFHDITRQQIEHVVQTLQRLRTEAESGRGNADSLPPDARAILTLQSSQVSGAAETFASSIERMERDLDSIAMRVQDMAAASRTLMGISVDDQNSFFLQMEGQFTAILEMLSTCITAQAEMESTAARLEETIALMRDSVAEIRGIEILIQRIATNATIRATHIGAAGNALNVIADVMQRLALDSNKITEEVAGTLDVMNDAGGRVSGANAACGAQPDKNEVIDEMRSTVLELHSSSECSYSRVNQIAILGARLAADISAVRNGLSAGPLFAQVAVRVRSELERIGAQAGRRSSEDAGVARTEHLESFAKHYTMQMERDVHDAVVRGSAITAGAPLKAPETVPEDGDLGDNVELF